MPPQRAACSISDAPTCTVGPSRPIEAPQNKADDGEHDLAYHQPQRQDVAASSSRRWQAAIACEMPLQLQSGCE